MSIVKISSIHKMREPSGSSSLSPQDLHAQAAIVDAICQRVLDDVAYAYVLAGHACELQGGERERMVANTLTRAVIAVRGTGMHSSRGYEKLVRMYFGQKISMVSARKDMRCRNADMILHRDEAYKTLDQIGARAYAALECEFKSGSEPIIKGEQ